MLTLPHGRTPATRASRRNTAQRRRIPARQPASCRWRASVPTRRPPATGFCPCDMDLAPMNSREFTRSRSPLPLPLQFVSARSWFLCSPLRLHLHILDLFSFCSAVSDFLLLDCLYAVDGVSKYEQCKCSFPYRWWAVSPMTWWINQWNHGWSAPLLMSLAMKLLSQPAVV